MSGGHVDRVSVELTPDEAKLVVAALRQFEPHWRPSEMDDAARTDLLAEIRSAIDHVTRLLGRGTSPTRGAAG